MNKESRVGPQGDQPTLELYASAEDGEMDSGEACHRREEVEVDLQWFLERRGQDSRPGCWRQSSTSQRDPLLRIMAASVDMFGGRALEQFFADGRCEPSARCRHVVDDGS
jgi:hypothetical protein